MKDILTTRISRLKLWVKNLTPQPPSLQGKGEKLPSPGRKGVGGEVFIDLLFTHLFKLDALLPWERGKFLRKFFIRVLDKLFSIRFTSESLSRKLKICLFS